MFPRQKQIGLSTALSLVIGILFAVQPVWAEPTTKKPHKHNQHKHGHHKHGHHKHDKHQTFTPYKDIAKYIKRLESPKRKKWQKPDAVVRALKLNKSDRVADIGAGGGYFTVRFARVVTRGKVFAVEIESKMLSYITRRAKRLKLKNIVPVQSTSSDPKLPGKIDVTFMCNVLHHVGYPVPFLKKMAASMKSGARFVLVEFKMGKIPIGPPEKHRLSVAKQIALAKAAGLKFHREIKGILPYQHLLVFKKP